MFVFKFADMYYESEDSQDSYSGYVKHLYIYKLVTSNVGRPTTKIINDQIETKISKILKNNELLS